MIPHNRPWTFIDVETTGLEPGRYGIHEIGIVLDDGRSWSIECKPHRDEYDEMALAISRKKPSDIFARELPERQAIAEMLGWLEARTQGLLVQVGKNPNFDRSFILACWGGVNLPRFTHRCIDLNSLIYLYAMRKGIDINHPQMQSIVKKDLNLPEEEEPHTAARGAAYHKRLFDVLALANY